MAVHAVDKTKFRTCQEQGFCRDNLRSSNTSDWIYIPGSLSPHSTDQSGAFKGQLGHSHDAETGMANFYLYIYENSSSIRLWIEDKENSPTERYSLPIGEIIQPMLIMPMNLLTLVQEESVTKISWMELEVSFCLILNHYPFFITFTQNSIPILIINKNSRLIFEQNGDRNHGNEGFLSVGFDIDFPQSTNLYGIPEHAAHFSLPATVRKEPHGMEEYISDPYRLFNLDVFEYELDSTMAL